MSGAPAIVFRNVTREFATKDSMVVAVQNLSCSVETGEVLAIVGPSGCGKSTLLRLASGLIPVTNGEVLAFGQPVTDVQDGVGMVFQSPTLLPWRTVLGNVLLPAAIRRLDPNHSKTVARELLQLTGLQDFERAYPHQLSGGMQQRVSLCRTLLTDPPILMMDEPFAALDALSRDNMNLELMRIWHERPGKTMLFVTHSIQEAVFVADAVLVMTPRPGRMLELVETRLPRPRSLATRSTPAFQELVLRISRLLGVGSH